MPSGREPVDDCFQSEPGVFNVGDIVTHDGEDIVVLGTDGKTPIGTITRADIEKAMMNENLSTTPSHLTPAQVRENVRLLTSKILPRGPQTGRMGVTKVRFNAENLKAAMGATNPCGEVALGPPKPCVLNPVPLCPDIWHNAHSPVESSQDPDGWDDLPMDP